MSEREIKFRAWDKVYKEYNYDVLPGNLLEALHNEGLSAEDKERFILEQCTGLKDKNGKEIFEGDIVRHERLVTFPDNYHTGEPTGVDTTYIRTGKIAWNPSMGIHLVGKQTVIDYHEDKILHKDVKWRGQLRCWGEMAEIIGTIHDSKAIQGQ